MPALTYRTTLPRPDDPTILDPLANLLEEGVPLRYAAAMVGISESTAYHWVTEGASELAALEAATPDETPRELGPVALFAQTVKEYRARCVVKEVRAWDRADGKEWAKHATKLERLFPQEFSKTLRTEGEQTVTHRLELPAGYQQAAGYLDAVATPPPQLPQAIPSSIIEDTPGPDGAKDPPGG